MTVSRQTIAVEVMRQAAHHPAGTPDEAILQAAANALAIPLELVAEAINQQPA